jgi:hypothetical protein
MDRRIPASLHADDPATRREPAGCGITHMQEIGGGDEPPPTGFTRPFCASEPLPASGRNAAPGAGACARAPGMIPFALYHLLHWTKVGARPAPERPRVGVRSPSSQSTARSKLMRRAPTCSTLASRTCSPSERGQCSRCLDRLHIRTQAVVPFSWGGSEGFGRPLNIICAEPEYKPKSRPRGGSGMSDKKPPPPTGNPGTRTGGRPPTGNPGTKTGTRPTPRPRPS